MLVSRQLTRSAKETHARAHVSYKSDKAKKGQNFMKYVQFNFSKKTHRELINGRISPKWKQKFSKTRNVNSDLRDFTFTFHITE